MNTFAALKDIRSRAGNPSPNELSQEQIATALDAALAEYSRLRPLQSYVPVTIVRGQDIYPVAEGVTGVKDFLFSIEGVTTDLLFDFGSLLGWPIDFTFTEEYAGISVFDNPSLMTIWHQKKESWSRQAAYTWEFDRGIRALRIMPPPQEYGKGIYIGLRRHKDAQTVLPEDEDAVLDLGIAEALEIMVRASRVQSMPLGAGSLTIRVDELHRNAKALRERALARLGGGGSSIVIG